MQYTEEQIKSMRLLISDLFESGQLSYIDFPDDYWKRICRIEEQLGDHEMKALDEEKADSQDYFMYRK